MTTTHQFQKVVTRRSEPAGGTQRTRLTSQPSGQLLFLPACEALLGILIVLAIGAALPGQAWGLVHVQPHPLWIVVLAIAVRYGAASGYLAGGLSALTYGLLIWTRPEARFELLAPHDLIGPFLMLAVGAVVGELVDARERRVEDLEVRHRDAEGSLQALWQRHRALEKVRAELENQIAFQSRSVVVLSTVGRRLQSLHVRDLHNAIAELVATTLEAQACSLYGLSEGRLLLKAVSADGRLGRLDGGHAIPRIVNAQNPLIGRAIRERRVVTIRDRLLMEGSQSIADEPILMAGPLILSGDQVYGVVVIESMPFIKLTPASIDLLEMILGWGSAALENALLHEQSLQKLDVFQTPEYRRAPTGYSAPRADVRVSK